LVILVTPSVATQVDNNIDTHRWRPDARARTASPGRDQDRVSKHH
jgi:hypothetical protein